jgi:hypothetical protein
MANDYPVLDTSAPTAQSKLPKFPAPMTGGLYAPPTADQIKMRQYMAGPGMQPTGPATNPDEESPAASMPALTPAAVSPPSKAANAAGDAAARALGKDSVDQATDGPGAQLSPGYRVNTSGAGDAGDVGPWNKFVESQIASLSGLSPDKTRAVLAQPLPSAGRTGAPGQAATNLNTTTGAPQRLNYGYGTEIIGQGKSASGKLNNFSGVGQGALPEGAAAVFGSGGAPAAGGAAAGAGAGNPFDRVQAHLMDIMQQSYAKAQAGDGIGAKRLERHAQSVANMFQTVSQHMYQQGLLSAQSRSQKLAEMVAAPGIATGSAAADAATNGEYGRAAKIAAATQGKPTSALTQVVPGLPGYNAFDGDAELEAALNYGRMNAKK